MRLKSGFGLRDVCGEKVLMAEGIENIDYSRVIHLNETAAFLWTSLEQKDFVEEDMVAALTKEYEVPADVALADCRELLKLWQEAGLVVS